MEHSDNFVRVFYLLCSLHRYMDQEKMTGKYVHVVRNLHDKTAYSYHETKKQADAQVEFWKTWNVACEIVAMGRAEAEESVRS